jgi:lysophospholipase L1-like esterase
MKYKINLRRHFCLAVCLIFGVSASFYNLFGQVREPNFQDSIFGTYFHQKVSIINTIPPQKDEIIFLGNSITDSGEWTSLFGDKRIVNMGISGDVTSGVLHRLKHVLQRNPTKIFLMIGTNDLARGISIDSVLNNMLWIADYIHQHQPLTKIYVQSILPVNDHYGKFSGHTKNNNKIVEINQKLSKNQEIHHYIYVDLHSHMTDENGKLITALSNDGLHPMGEAYQMWKHLIFHHIYDLNEKPALIPQPQKLTWNKEIFPLYQCSSIRINTPSITHEASVLQQFLHKKGIRTSIQINPKISNGKVIEILITNERLSENQKEGYHLSVNANKILLKANTPHGVFNGIQTLMQLSRTGSTTAGCEIEDWPAYDWRGYMIDVGRNFVSMKSLKEQIDVLARYKMNIFHFHATEDIAWRIQIASYPQLTAPEHVLRNKGMYYSIAEIKELIQYCKDRHITLIPEIDMPGHSAAFTRAMKFDMQSDSGLMVVKNILAEFCDTYDVPYIHIGSDEVKISNKNFIPEVTKLIESKGKQVISWQPGGNFGDNTIRQMWQENTEFIKTNKNLKLVDSRHLYLNHMDPLEAVPTIFFRKIGNVSTGDSLNLGGILCVWHDRAVAQEADILTMNPVYPGILTFAERTWQGGGQTKWLAKIEENKVEQFSDFVNFEKRLINHKSQYFIEKPFPYVAQSTQKWDLFGPYNNKGELSKKFDPEMTPKFYENTKPTLTAVGGTIVLRHFWTPMIEGVLPNPKDSTTWYASTQIWSNEDKVSKFWIGFTNLGRAQGSDSPPKGRWDHKASKIWCNNEEVLPPNWLRADQKGNLEIPLMDEGYEYRSPTLIPLKKGWNSILIKSPIGTTKSTSWHHPIKWMFTCIKLE